MRVRLMSRAGRQRRGFEGKRAAGLLLALCVPAAAHLVAADPAVPSAKAAHLPIRLLNLWSFGDSITQWVESGTTTFAQINWRNHNLSRYAFSDSDKPAAFLQGVATSRGRLRERADQAHRLGLLAYLNEYELNFPDFIPPESLRPLSAREKFMEEKLYELLVECPWLEGYMITPTESKLGVRNPGELRAVVLGAYKGLKRAEEKLGKKRYLFVRSWLSAASMLARVRSYFPITTDPAIAKDIIIVCKDGLGDFVMRRPLNPLFGAILPHSILAEFDVSVSEYRSLGWYPQGPADLWGYRIQQLVSTPGVVGINIHTGRLNEVPGLTPEQLFPRFKENRILYPFHGGVRWSPWQHLNVTTIFALLRDPWKPSREIYEQWGGANYGAAAAKPLADLLLLADDALYGGMLTFGVNLNNHSGFIVDRQSPIRGMGRSIQYQLRLQPNLTPLFEISPDTVDRALAEKRHSLELIDSMIATLAASERAFQACDYKALRTDLLRMRGAMKGYELTQAGYFVHQLAIAEPPVVNRAYYVGLLKRMVEEGEALVDREPEFLHQKTDRSFVHFTRAVRSSLEERGLWR
jgi:hypothetical protein